MCIRDRNTINDALSQLKRAREGLVAITEEDKKADKQELQALLEKYNTYKAKDYTTESWNVFKGVLDRANQIYQDDQVNQETVDAVVAVSYTHLDVYKRQRQKRIFGSCMS